MKWSNKEKIHSSKPIVIFHNSSNPKFLFAIFIFTTPH
ncbi:hypothetical protein M092_2433 [Parabacteroides distasonis str. 3776 D15 iv]|nr:hypothetical protein M092_2433 [Parabacteroides distasonis str. 3776 D15 iv]